MYHGIVLTNRKIKLLVKSVSGEKKHLNQYFMNSSRVEFFCELNFEAAIRVPNGTWKCDLRVDNFSVPLDLHK